MSSNDLPWPNDGDKFFAAANGGREVNMWLAIYGLNGLEGLYPDGFKEAADLVIEQYSRDTGPPYRDQLLFPVCFLYRHYLELKMKQLLRLGERLQLVTVSEKKIWGSHDLGRLWGKAKELISARWPDADETPVNVVEAVINEISQVDPSGQTFRYDVSSKGEYHFDAIPETVDLRNMRKTMDGVFHFLDGCCMDFSETLDTYERYAEYP